MKIKKRLYDSVACGQKMFELRNDNDKEGFYILETKGKKEYFYLKFIDDDFIRTKDDDEIIMEKIDDMFEWYNGLSTKENLDSETYQWLLKNLNYFKKTHVCAIYHWINIKGDLTIRNLEVEE